jgi:RNA polymerase sigma factor (sigma-70 family)
MEKFVGSHAITDNAVLNDNKNFDNKQIADQQLLNALAFGECNALCELMANYQDFLKNHCRKLMRGNREDANDLFSNVLFKIYTEKPTQLRKIRHIGGWLIRVAKNKCIDLQRVRKSEERRLDSLYYLYETINVQHLSPEQELLNHELICQIQKAFDSLPHRLRAVARLKLCEDTPYQEIAAQLDITPANARKRVQEARKFLADRLGCYL